MKIDELIIQLRKAVMGLVYVSEIDAPLHIFVWTATSVQTIMLISAARRQTLDDFFERYFVADPPPEEKANYEGFRQLKHFMANNLKNARVYRVGDVEVDIFIAGFDDEGYFGGVQIKAVET